MYKKRSYKPRRRYGRKPSKKVVRRTTRTSRAFTAKVKKVIHRMAENKTITSDASNESITPCDGVTAVPYYINLIPPLQQGTSAAERIGNQVRLMRNKIVGYINLLPYSATTNKYNAPVIVKMWVVSWKYAQSQYAQPALVDFSTFFQRGSATANFIGNPLDMIRDVNTDVWTVHQTRQFELSAVPNYNNNVTNVIYPNAGGPFSRKYSFNVSKYAKLLKFNDNISPSRATNKNLYLVIQTVLADGTSVSATDRYCENHYQNTIQYEDI